MESSFLPQQTNGITRWSSTKPAKIRVFFLDITCDDSFALFFLNFCFFSEENILASGSSVQGALEDEVRVPLPVMRDTLYEDPAFYRSDFFMSQ